MSLYQIDGVSPVIHPSSFVHPDAAIIGDVIIGANCYIGPLASLRGDFGQILIADGCNVQDGCVLHSFPGQQCSVGENGHIAHGAVLHGCTVKRHGFVGIKSVVMDGAIIGEYAMVAAMAFVKADFELPDRHMAAGLPARIIREMDDTQLKWLANAPFEYQHLAKRSLASLKLTEAIEQWGGDGPRLQLGPDASKPFNETKR
ncbi:MAG: transferase hexapeptide repeat family protein [Pseudomonadales bacterium]